MKFCLTFSKWEKFLSNKLETITSLTLFSISYEKGTKEHKSQILKEKNVQMMIKKILLL